MADSDGSDHGQSDQPIVLKTQGSFMPGGTVVTNPGTFDPIALTPEGRRFTAITPMRPTKSPSTHAATRW